MTPPALGDARDGVARLTRHRPAVLDVLDTDLAAAPAGYVDRVASHPRTLVEDLTRVQQDGAASPEDVEATRAGQERRAAVFVPPPPDR